MVEEIVIIGCNHKTAPIKIREKLVFPDESIKEHLKNLQSTFPKNEVLIISTCNRTEFYFSTENHEEIFEKIPCYLEEHFNLEKSEYKEHMYQYKEPDSIYHLFRVASSLDSMVIGETQILGQVKDAYDLAQSTGTVGKLLHNFFQRSFFVAKRVKTETRISEKSVSVSSVAVELAEKILGNLEKRNVMLIGAGKMSEITAKHLQGRGAASILVANRSIDKAKTLAERIGGSAIKFDEFYKHLPDSDIVISSTNAPHYIVKPDQVSKIISKRKQKPVFFIDIALPRDIDPAVNNIDNVYLYDIDDLQSVAAQNMLVRKDEYEKAMMIIGEEVGKFHVWLRTLLVEPTISNLQAYMDSIIQEELRKTLSKIENISEVDQEQIEYMTRRIMNKFLHLPIKNLKELIGEGKTEHLETIETLFELKK